MPTSPPRPNPLRATYRMQAATLVGRVLGGRYRLEREENRGGSGILFAAQDLQVERELAVKVVLPRASTGFIDFDRFLLEAQVTGALSHPNVVDVYDVGVEEDGLPFLVMPLLKGESLAGALAREGKLSPERALAWLLPIMGAVAVAHDAGVVHRDIKPENIFLSVRADGTILPKLLDFGIAKHVDGATLTRTGTVVGTPAYMSPEQALGESMGAASDVWSMGVLWYRVLSGRLPFSADTVAATLLRIVNRPAEPLNEVAPDLPRTLTLVIERALRRDPSARYTDVRKFARALLEAALSAEIPVPAAPDPRGLSAWPVWRKEYISAPGTASLVPPAPTTPVKSTAEEISPSRRGVRRGVAIAATVAAFGIVATTWSRAGAPHADTDARGGRLDVASAEQASKAKEPALGQSTSVAPPTNDERPASEPAEKPSAPSENERGQDSPAKRTVVKKRERPNAPREPKSTSTTKRNVFELEKSW